MEELKHTQPLIIHTNQGREFVSSEWNAIPQNLTAAIHAYKLIERAVFISMSQKATPGDNAVIENLNRTIKKFASHTSIKP